MSKALNEKPNAEPLPASRARRHHSERPLSCRRPRTKTARCGSERSALIQAEAQSLYELWRDVESAPPVAGADRKRDSHRREHLSLGDASG